MTEQADPEAARQDWLAARGDKPTRSTPGRAVDSDPERSASDDLSTGDVPERDQSQRESGSSGAAAAAPPAAPGKAPVFRRRGVLIVLALVVLVLLVGVLIWWWIERGYESTDDAFIDARTVRIAPRISGQVTRVLVNDNQLVHAGDLMVEIDPADASAALDSSTAQEAQAETALGQSQADVEVAEAQRKQAEQNVRGLEAQALNAQQDLRRYLQLKASTPQAVAQGQIDQAVAAARNLEAQRNAALQQVKSAEAQIVANRAAVAGAQARLETARAQRRTAQLNLGYTRIAAPVDGHVTRRNVAVGTYVTPGQQLLAVVPLNLWVTANFKETQLARVRPGQHATVRVDACPGVDLDAHVDSIQRGAGQAFALLPPENATGNYVKVVQRVPVKIILDQVPRDCALGPGMSVEPKVAVR